MRILSCKSKTGKDLFRFEMTEAEYLQREDEYIGYCIFCGSDKDSCEPDARQYECDECGRKKVYGTPELLVMGFITIVEETEE